MTETFDYLDIRSRVTRGPLRFSYSRPEQSWVNRTAIRTIERLSGQPGRCGRVGEVRRNRGRAPPESNHLFGCVGRAGGRVHHQVGAGPGETERHARTEAAGGARDERHLALQRERIHVHGASITARRLGGNPAAAG